MTYHTRVASAVNCIPCQPSCLQFGADHEGSQYNCVIMILNTAGSHAVVASAVCQTAMQLWPPQSARQPCSYGLRSVPDSHAIMASAVSQTAMQLWPLQCTNYPRSLAPAVNSILLSALNSASSVLTTKVDHKIVSTAQQTPIYLQQQNGWTVFYAYCEICV